MTRLLPVAAAVTVLLFSGLVHGLWTDRWSEPGDLRAAAARLPQLPLKLGEWEGEALPSSSRAGGGLHGTLSRRYVHRPTGKVVTVFLGCGRPGPVSIHTPDVCYTASGYKEVEKQEYRLPVKSAAAGAAFYTARYHRDKAGDNTQLRIFWSWTSGEQWEVAASPRMAFFNRPILYKLYVLREAGAGAQPLEGDPCLELMEQLLPALQREVLPKT
jgi:hypothetical protein